MYVTVCVGMLAESWTSLDIISMYQFDGLRIRGMSIEALQFLVRFLYSTFTFWNSSGRGEGLCISFDISVVFMVLHGGMCSATGCLEF